MTAFFLFFGSIFFLLKYLVSFEYLLAQQLAQICTVCAFAADDISGKNKKQTKKLPIILQQLNARCLNFFAVVLFNVVLRCPEGIGWEEHEQSLPARDYPFDQCPPNVRTPVAVVLRVEQIGSR